MNLLQFRGHKTSIPKTNPQEPFKHCFIVFTGVLCRFGWSHYKDILSLQDMLSGFTSGPLLPVTVSISFPPTQPDETSGLHSVRVPAAVQRPQTSVLESYINLLMTSFSPSLCKHNLAR